MLATSTERFSSQPSVNCEANALIQ